MERVAEVTRKKAGAFRHEPRHGSFETRYGPGRRVPAVEEESLGKEQMVGGDWATAIWEKQDDTDAKAQGRSDGGFATW